MPEEFLVGGAIETRWKVWGAAEGPFGKAVGPEEDVPGRNGRRQAFERGEIVWSADQEMVLSAFRLRDEVCFEFSKTRFTYDHYRMNYFFNGVPQGQNESTTSNSDGQSPTIIHWVGVQGYGEFAFHARGEDDDDDSAQGWAIPVRVRLDPVPGTPDPAWPPVTGVIAERWHELGAWDGPLGKPVGREDFNPDGGIRNQEFEYGRIFTAPELGPRMVVAGYQRGRSIELTWGGSDWGFNKMTVEVSHNGTVISQETIETGGVGSFHSLRWARPGDRGGRFRLDATQGDGLYTFNLYPRVSDAGPPIAHIPTIALWYERGPHDALIETLATDTTPALAFASHASRTTSVARHYVRTRPLRPSFTAATEDNSIQLIAHLHMASVDPAFCARGELPPRILASAALGSLNRGHGQVGTSFNEEFLGVKLRRDGDYDMALKGLMVIAYRYRALLTQEQVDFIVNVLVPSYLRGPHDPKLESYAILTENVPETENHMLMINSSRYLVNQLLHDRTGDPKYDNVGNGLMAWLLIYLNVISKHDFLEFNARPYQRLSLHVLFNLHEFARDNSVRTAAKILLDYTMVKFAVSSNRQRRISPFRRLKENTNSPTKINDMLRDGIGGDPVTGFFLSYTGPSGRDGKPARWFPDGWTFNALIAGPADYRPPPAAYILALTRFAPAQHVFNHGRRPQMPEADEDADGGVEIYHRSASFLLTAGGAWLNSGYGLDEFTGYKQVAIAQSTTLMFTRAFDVRVKPEDVDLRIELDTKFADLIRFDRWPSVDDDGEAVERDAVNTAVHTGFACGANLEVPDLWLQLGGATWDGPWLFLDLNRPSEALPEHLRPYGPLGAYVAIYRTTLGPADIELLESQYDAVPPKNVGFLYAMEADTVDPATGTAMTFAAFRDGIRARNATFSNPLDWAAFYVFHSPDNHKYDFWLRSDQHKYRPRVELDDQALPPGGFEALPLVSGPYLRTPGGHDGRFEVRHPGCDHPLVLDFSDQHNPVYLDNIAACPQPWLDRGYALLVFAQTLRNAGKPTEAAGAMVERVRVYQRMAEADRGTYLPRMAIALFELVLYHRAGLSPASALAFAHDGLTAYEELAGLREPGSQDPVDYDHLAAFTPNEHWIW
ncbi:LGFP repeat-containing protein, partial [Streptosporangium sandarakinum]|uniref:LGFP repeat-containing protein n=1 Tax=Streptosporangium sandarakinum TaxID=1260955 RepID=UPI0037970B74